jgi:hypothetical protein
MATRAVSVGRGLAEVQAGAGTFIAYSTKPGELARDGEGRNSPFTAALTKAVSTPGKPLTALMVDVRREVLAATGNKQVPWDHSALVGDFYFQLASAPAMLKTPPASPPSESAAMQERIKQLEEELKRKADPQTTVKLVELSQLKERVRQIEEANRQDERASFDLFTKWSRAQTKDARDAMDQDRFAIQRRIGERSGQLRTLRGQISKLEEELGTAKPAAAAK